MKFTMIGGGSFFTATILHGIAHVAERRNWDTSGLQVCLFDIDPDRAQLMADYGRLLVEKGLLHVSFGTPTSRADALDGADLVIESVPFREENERARRLREEFHIPGEHQGPGSIPILLGCMPFLTQLADEMTQRCPRALLLILTNPTDMFADAVSRATGIRACGLCVEVYHLIDHLAFYFQLDPDDIRLHTVGVNHAGWSLRFLVGDRDGYALIRDRMDDVLTHPDFHPGNMLMVEAFRLTGYLRSSAFHPWPYQPSQPPVSYQEFGKRHAVVRGRGVLDLVREAIRTRTPLEGPIDQPPELIPIRYRGTGRGVGCLLHALATGAEEVVTLQLRNAGAVSNWDPDFFLELAVRARGRELTPIRIGQAPDWLTSFEKALALHNKLAVDYCFDRRIDTLKRALSAVHLLTPTGALTAFAHRLHQ